MAVVTYKGIRGIKKLSQQSKYYAKRVRSFRSEQAQYYRDYAIEMLTSLSKKPTGETASKIKSYVTDTRIGIVSRGRGTEFIEYGTGIVGAEGKKNPAQPADWKHDINGHGEEGWRYGKGYRRWTAGQVAKPFMLYTRLEIEQNLLKDFRNEFKKAFK